MHNKFIDNVEYRPDIHAKKFYAKAIENRKDFKPRPCSGITLMGHQTKTASEYIRCIKDNMTKKIHDTMLIVFNTLLNTQRRMSPKFLAKKLKQEEEKVEKVCKLLTEAGLVKKHDTGTYECGLKRKS